MKSVIGVISVAGGIIPAGFKTVFGVIWAVGVILFLVESVVGVTQT